MIQQLLNQTSTPQGRCKWQMPLRCLLHIIDEFRCTEPTLFTFHISVFGSPSNFCAECLKVLFGLFILFLLGCCVRWCVEEVLYDEEEKLWSEHDGILLASTIHGVIHGTCTHLLYTVAKLPTGELGPETFNSGKISWGDILHFGKVNKVPSFGFGSC